MSRILHFPYRIFISDYITKLVIAFSNEIWIQYSLTYSRVVSKSLSSSFSKICRCLSRNSCSLALSSSTMVLSSWPVIHQQSELKKQFPSPVVLITLYSWIEASLSPSLSSLEAALWFLKIEHVLTIFTFKEEIFFRLLRLQDLYDDEIWRCRYYKRKSCW